MPSGSPKNCWKNGSLKNGEVRCRTTWIDEMLATARTVCSATRVKSGPGAAVASRVRAAASSAARAPRGCATATSSLRMRPVSTRPAIRPATMKARASERRLIIGEPRRCRVIGRSRGCESRSAPARQETSTRRGPRSGAFGTTMVSTPSRRSAAILFDVDRRGQGEGARELAVPALDLVVLLAGHARVAAALQRDAAVVHLDAHLVARQARQFGGDDERVGGFAQVDGRRPALRGRTRTVARADVGWPAGRAADPSGQMPRIRW